jgi:hypothetical protein
MIVTQQAYSANTKVITTAQEMLRDGVQHHPLNDAGLPRVTGTRPRRAAGTQRE